jgi:hypothetical protein
MHKLNENLYIKFGEVTSALGGESSDVLTTLTFVDAQNFDTIGVIGIASEVASDSVIALRLWEATAANGGGSASLTTTYASDTFTSTNTTDVDQLFVQVRSADLSAGYPFVGAKISTSNASGTEEAAMIFVCGNPRYGGASMSEA